MHSTGDTGGGGNYLFFCCLPLRLFLYLLFFFPIGQLLWWSFFILNG